MKYQETELNQSEPKLDQTQNHMEIPQSQPKNRPYQTLPLQSVTNLAKPYP